MNNSICAGDLCRSEANIYHWKLLRWISEQHRRGRLPAFVYVLADRQAFWNCAKRRENLYPSITHSLFAGFGGVTGCCGLCFTVPLLVDKQRRHVKWRAWRSEEKPPTVPRMRTVATWFQRRNYQSLPSCRQCKVMVLHFFNTSSFTVISKIFAVDKSRLHFYKG